jgi:hypothetical protein
MPRIPGRKKPAIKSEASFVKRKRGAEHLRCKNECHVNLGPAAIHILGESYRLEGEARRVGRRSAGLSGPFSNPLVWQVLAQSQEPHRRQLDCDGLQGACTTIEQAK